MKKLLAALLFTFGSFVPSLKAQSYIVKNYAGNGAASYFAPIIATSAELHNPCSVTADGLGNIYIADYDNYRVRKVNPGDSISNIAGNGTSGYSGDGRLAVTSKISSPTGIAVDDTGNVYIADYGNSRIRKVNTNGIITTFAGNGTAGDSGDYGLATAAKIKYPLGITFDHSGNLFIAEGLSNCVREVNVHGIITTFAGNYTPGYSGDGGQATSAELDEPYGIAVDDSGNVYIADEGNNRIRKVNTHGIITTIAGNGTSSFSGDGAAATAAALNQPQGIAIDGSGNMYITDHNNQRIRMVNTSGIITSIAGNGTRGFTGDGGPGTSAELNNPSGEVAIDHLGNVYIADLSNQRIRKLTIAGAGINGLNVANGNIKVYPNPNSGVFNIGINDKEQGISMVEIYNMLGEKIYSQQLFLNTPCTINLSSQPTGIYLYRVNSESGTPISSGKFVIER